jgi:hypothetical protein
MLTGAGSDNLLHLPANKKKLSGKYLRADTT